MRLLITTVIALIVSVLAAGTMATALAEWTKADQSYILVFMMIAPAALLASAVFLFASTRGSIGPAAIVMLSVIATAFIVFAAIAHFSMPLPGSKASEVKLITAMALTLAGIVIPQWLIFRVRERRRGA